MSEKQNIEWKQSWRDEYLQWICAFTKYIDTWGRGTLKIYKACKEAGLPEPIIIEKDGGIEVTLYKIDISEKLRRSFVETSQKMNDDINHNLELMSSNYGVFIDFLAMDTDSTSEKLRRNFGETSEEFRKNFGDKKAVLLVLITADPSISASAAAKFLGVSPRSVQTYFNDLKENVLERIGPDKGGFWKITVE